MKNILAAILLLGFVVACGGGQSSTQVSQSAAPTDSAQPTDTPDDRSTDQPTDAPSDSPAPQSSADANGWTDTNAKLPVNCGSGPMSVVSEGSGKYLIYVQCNGTIYVQEDSE